MSDCYGFCSIRKPRPLCSPGAQPNFDWGPKSRDIVTYVPYAVDDCQTFLRLHSSYLNILTLIFCKQGLILIDTILPTPWSSENSIISHHFWVTLRWLHPSVDTARGRGKKSGTSRAPCYKVIIFQTKNGAIPTLYCTYLATCIL